MRKTILSALLSIMTALCYAQKETTEATFPEGNKAMMQFIYNNLRYPVDCLQENVQGTVNVVIEINKDGSIGNTTIESSPHKSLSDEVLRIVKLFPKWIPAQIDGKNVTSKVTLPVVFRLDSGEQTKPKSVPVKCAERPETIVTFVVKQHEPEWYTAQAMAWQKEVDKNPQDEWAWRNLFYATYYDDMFYREGETKSELKTTDVLRKMQAALPDSYVLNLSKLRFCLPGDSQAYTSYHAQRAIELMPENAHSEDVTRLACRMWQTAPDNAVAKELFTRGYKQQHFPSHLMHVNWNMLKSMQPEAIYFANGDAVAMPMKMLQCALDIRTDVTVIPIFYLHDEEFRGALYRKLNIAPFHGDHKAYIEQYGWRDGSKRYEADAMMHIIHESKRPSYFSTYNISYNTLNKDSLYNEGLLLKWSDQPYDNFAVAMNNVKNVYHLEYLAEPNLEYDSWEASGRMDLNHITQLAHLISKFRKAGDSNQADRLYHILSTCLDLHDAEPELKQYYRKTLEEQKTGNGK